jgi:hypothetical protein
MSKDQTSGKNPPWGEAAIEALTDRLARQRHAHPGRRYDGQPDHLECHPP